MPSEKDRNEEPLSRSVADGWRRLWRAFRKWTVPARRQLGRIRRSARRRGWRTAITHQLMYWLYQRRLGATLVAVTVVVVISTITLASTDASIRCLGDCGSPRDGQGWIYKTNPSCFATAPPMMMFRSDVKDFGPFGRMLLPFIWYLPLLPPALFVAAAIRACSPSDRALFTRDFFSLALRAILRGMPLILYVGIGLLGTMLREPAGGVLIFYVAAATWVVAALQWRIGTAAFTVKASPGEHRRRRDGAGRRRLDLQRRGVVLALGIAMGGLLNGSAALLIRDTSSLKDLMHDRHPRLYGSVSVRELERQASGVTSSSLEEQIPDRVSARIRLAAIDRLMDVLERPGLATTGDMRDVRSAVQAVAEVPSALHNPISQSLCRSGWYISVCCACLAAGVLLFGTRSGAAVLGFVMTSYLSIGLVFGLIYYDYWVRDAARYNMLIEVLCVNSAREIDNATARCDDCSPRLKRLSAIQANLVSNRKAMNIMASGYFAASVFAQDAPEVTVESDPPPVVKRVFSTTYQFRLRRSFFEPDLPLYYGLRPVERSASCVERLRAVYGDGSAAVRTNAASSARMAMFLCRELTTEPLSEEISYTVRATGGADCRGTERRNESYSARRGARALNEGRGVLNDVVTTLETGDPVTGSLLNPVRLARLTEAFDEARPNSVVTQRGAEGGCNPFEYDETLWPRESRDLSTGGATLNPARAAVVQILLRSADVGDRIHMQSGLSREATLMDMVYFSFVCFTTTGYGDMKAVSGPVRFCVIIENVLEILFAAIFFTAAMEVKRRWNG